MNKNEAIHLWNTRAQSLLNEYNLFGNKDKERWKVEGRRRYKLTWKVTQICTHVQWKLVYFGVFILKMKWFSNVETF